MNSEIASNGLYFVFEDGERGHGGDRITRIGCHTGPGNLAYRLKEHTTENKDRSIFRKNIGRALLAKTNDPFLKVWNLDLTKRMQRELHGNLVDRDKLADVERAVTSYIMANISVAIVPIYGERLDFERLCIATVAQCAVCRPSENWLGRLSPEAKIRHGGLWQVQHIAGKRLAISDWAQLQLFANSVNPG